MENQPKEIHVGKLLVEHLAEKRYNKAALARREGWQARKIAYYFKRPSMPTAMLVRICYGFRYNFFRQIADMLPPEFPSQPNSMQAENDALKKEIEILKIKIELLEKVAGVKRQE